MLERCVAGATSIWMLEPYLRKRPRPGGRASCSSRHRLPISCGAYGQSVSLARCYLKGVLQAVPITLRRCWRDLTKAIGRPDLRQAVPATAVPTSSSPLSPLSNRQLGRRSAYQWSYVRSCWQRAGSGGKCCRRDHWSEGQREMQKPSSALHRCSRARRCTRLLRRYWHQRPAALLPGACAAPECSGRVGRNCQEGSHLPGQQ